MKRSEVIEQTFWAISAAMGWDKEYPVELERAVAVRLRRMYVRVDVEAADQALKEKLNPGIE